MTTSTPLRRETLLEISKRKKKKNVVCSVRMLPSNHCWMVGPKRTEVEGTDAKSWAGRRWEIVAMKDWEWLEWILKSTEPYQEWGNLRQPKGGSRQHVLVKNGCTNDWATLKEQTTRNRKKWRFRPVFEDLWEKGSITKEAIGYTVTVTLIELDSSKDIWFKNLPECAWRQMLSGISRNWKRYLISPLKFSSDFQVCAPRTPMSTPSLCIIKIMYLYCYSVHPTFWCSEETWKARLLTCFLSFIGRYDSWFRSARDGIKTYKHTQR